MHSQISPFAALRVPQFGRTPLLTLGNQYLRNTRHGSKQDHLRATNEQDKRGPNNGLDRSGRWACRFARRAQLSVQEIPKSGYLKYLAAILVGATSVIAGRWIDFTYLDTALGFAAEKGMDAALMIANVPTALTLAVLISVIGMFVLGLRSKQTVPLQAAGFGGAFVFEAELVAMAPTLYARFYPQSWITEMVANATLLT